MMKKIFINFILSLCIICSAPRTGHAITFNIDDIEAIQTLNNNIVGMASSIYEGSAKMMKYAEMIKCYSDFGKASYITISIPIIPDFSIHLIEPMTWISGWTLLILGFFIMMIASFYMFDVTFNISIALFFMPLGFALWPFGWTRDKLKPIIESFVYYTGVFIFLPLGIHIAKTMVENIIDAALASQEGTNGRSFEEIFQDGQSDILKESLGVTSTAFLLLLVTYILAIRIIPLMAGEFCTHFFGSSLAGSPMKSKIEQGIQMAKNATIGRAGKYAKDVVKHQSGNFIKRHTNRNSKNFVSRFMNRYGRNLARTRRSHR